MTVLSTSGETALTMSALACHFNQVTHQQMAEAPALPFVADGNRTFTAGTIVADAKATNANLSFLTCLMAQRYECHVASVIDVGEPPDHIVTRIDLTEKSIFLRLGRQAFNERALDTGIFLANRADQHASTVTQCLVPVRHRIEIGDCLIARFRKSGYHAWWRRTDNKSHRVLLFDGARRVCAIEAEFSLTEVKQSVRCSRSRGTCELG